MRTLLLADPARVKSLKTVLKKEGLAVEVVENLELADFKLETRSFEVVLIDQMPKKIVPMLVAWRFKGVNANIIVLLPSACSAADRTRCLDAGADVCMTHPIVVEELRAQLRALSRRSSSAPDPVRRLHDLEINSADRTVRRGGRPIKLTPQEFNLLELLAAHPGEVLTQNMIREHLVDGVKSVSSNIVSVYIRLLRMKIDEGFDLPLILTRWGQGYLLRPEESSDD